VSQIPRRSERPKSRDKVTKKTTTIAPAQYEDEDEEGTSSDCPEPNGFFADADQCDKYHACSDGKIEGNLRF
jgi:Chitin binding Peritrophin-A domain